MIQVLPALCAVMLALAPQAAAQPAGPTIEAGSSVRIEYTLSNEAGAIIASTREPVTYVQGRQQLFPALERALLGLAVGQAKRVVLKPEEAFGPIDPQAVGEVDRGRLPPESLAVGATVVATDPWGNRHPVRVKAIRGDTVVLDYNHPLAGKTLAYDVRVLAIERSSGASPGR